MAHLSTISTHYTATIVDLSATGARLRGAKLPAEDEELYFSVHTVRTVATVKWRMGNECGLQFAEPLLQQDVVSIRMEVARGAGLPPELRGALDDWVLGVAR